ncbi:MAG: deoxyribonuclease IV [Actinomycetota bacterium]|nr:deoxyribonuclease IV [Actinomycetota bacterium]
MPPRKPSPLGAHVLVAGGLVRAGLPYLEQVSAEAVQIFAGNPRGWALAAGDPAEDETFRATCADRGWPVFVHAPYLVNIGSPTEATLVKSVASLRHSLARGKRLGAAGVVVHAGSAVAAGARDHALGQLREHLLPLLDEMPADGPALLVEPTAGGPAALAAAIGDLEPYFAALEDHPRLGVCLDTCHLHAAGHDLASPGGVRTALTALVRAVGRGRLGLVHANDSRDPLGSGRDRHARIGAGSIGADSFAELFRHPATRGVPVVIETPGSAEQQADDLRLLRALRDT